MSGRHFFVTGAGTEIGKTHVAAGLLRAACARGRTVAALKPVMSGFDPADPAGSDAGLLLAAAGTVPTDAAVAAISPWRYADPVSPDMAAARVGERIDFVALLQFCRDAAAAAADVLLIEGAGGAMAPVGEHHTALDLMAALDLPAILVTGTYLGAISHALTAHAALRGAGVPVAVVVASESAASPVPPAEIAATIARFLPGTPVALVGRAAAGSDAEFARLAGLLFGREGEESGLASW